MTRRGSSRGFTLIELLVSLTAGLIIAISVAGLAKIATNTFYEESRVQVAELSLRIAVDRLRSDLSRASYMSTPSVLVDPLLVLPAGTAAYSAPGFPNGLGRLSGITYLPDSFGQDDDPNNTIRNLSTRELGAVPDRLIIGGNLTTADEYIVQSITGPGGGGCGGDTVTLSVDSPAISRLVRAANGTLLPPAAALTALTAAFAPAAGGAQWMARIVDDTGRRQFVALCATTPAVSMAGNAPVINVQPTTPILTATQSGAQGGSTGFGVGRLTINPVQLVEWSVRNRSAASAGNPAWARDTGPDAGTKFDLVRQYLDATGARVGAAELVAEYIVDFEIGLVVENPAPGATPRMQVVPFDATANALVAQHSAAVANVTQGPQWVRSLRYRMATRAPIADREVTLTRPAGTTGYAYRYCTVVAGCAQTPRHARVRTLTGEVSLPNQARFP